MFSRELVWRVSDLLADETNGPASRALRDLVFLGCRLHAEGHHEAGLKAARSALVSAGVFDADPDAAQQFMLGIAGNESLYMANIGAHTELLPLVPN